MKKQSVEMFLLALLALSIEFANCSNENSDYGEIQEILSEYESRMRYPEGYKDVVLVMGNTGAGKTTFTQWIAGDNSNLISVEVGEDTGEYVIIDNNRIGNSTIVSKTIYPEFVEDYDNDTGTVRNGYYDLPGFADSRGVKYDIASSYFIKRILEDCFDPKICHITRIKILLVVNYSSVRFGVDRKSLRRLLTHVTEIFKNSDRYLDGIGLVVTKVENIPIMGRDGSFHLVSDKATISNVVSFLQNAVKDIEEEFLTSNMTAQKESINSKSVALLNALISHSHERIALFRRPNQEGPLDKIDMLQEGKQRVNFVVENLKPILTENDDFGYTVSDETKTKLYNVIDATQSSLEENISALANGLYKQYTGKVDIIKNKIEHEVKLQDMPNAINVIVEIKELRNEVKESCGKINKLAQQLEHVESFKIVPKLIKDALNDLNVNISQQILLDISIQAKFLDFLKESLTLNFHVTPLVLALQNTAYKIDHFSKNVDISIDRLNVLIDDKIKHDINSTFLALKQEFDKYEIGIPDLQELKNVSHYFCDSIIEAQNLSDPTEVLQKLNRSVQAYKIIIPPYILQNVVDMKHISFITKQIDSLVAYMLASQAWYIFINELYIKLSSYSAQSNENTLERCIGFTQNPDRYEGRNVQDTNIDFILQDCDSNLYDKEFDSIKNVSLTKQKIQLLTNVVNFTLSNKKMTQSCNGTKLIVNSHFVKLSDFDINACTLITHFQVFASEKVFIDRDLDFTGQNIEVVIMAPVWEVVGIRKIILDGNSGKEIWTRDLSTRNGKPGLPGGNAGNFLGYGEKFVNGQNLFISADGGDGAPGQYGIDGERGQDGVIPHYLNEWEKRGYCDRLSTYNFDDWVDKGYISGITRCYESGVADCKDYTLVGQPCTDGWDGGRGGSGGEGGLAGTVRVSFNASFVISALNGSTGVDGSPGSGGRPGFHFAKVVVRETREEYFFIYKRKYMIRSSTYYSCHSGYKPSNHEVNSEGMQKAASRLAFMDEKMIFNEFSTYLEDNMELSYSKNFLSEFLQHCRELSLQNIEKTNLSEETTK